MDDEESSGKAAVLAGRARVAQVLDWPQLAVVAAGLAGQLPGPRLGPWRLGEVYEYALEHGRSHRVPLYLWPDQPRPGVFWGAIDLPGAVALRWGTPIAPVSMVWTLADEPERPYDRDVVELLPDGDFVVRVCHDFGTAGPNLDWLRRGLPAKRLSPSWYRMSQVLGGPLPWWPGTLRKRELIKAWQPDAEPVRAAVVASLNTRPLLELAAMLDHADPAAAVLNHLARKAMHQAAESAASDIRIVGELPDTECAALAAWPMPVAEPEELDATVRRAGWISILGRGDDLAARCVEEAIRWDGGDWFPYSRAEDLDPNASRWVQEWAKRLQPTPRTAAFRLIDRDRDGVPLVDPLTDAPVVRDERGRLVATVPQRLPASTPLSELILDCHDMIWVRTADGTLWPAPCDAYWGISWGYSGSGPGTLTLLVQSLLDDITAQAPDTNQGGSKHLEKFFQQKLRAGTVLTRAQLQAVMDGRPIALDGGVEEDE